MVVLTREMVEAGLSDDGTNLNLSDNQITHLEPGVFNGLGNLVDLSLYNNPIEVIYQSTYDYFTQRIENNLDFLEGVDINALERLPDEEYIPPEEEYEIEMSGLLKGEVNGGKRKKKSKQTKKRKQKGGKKSTKKSRKQKGGRKSTKTSKRKSKRKTKKTSKRKH